MVLIMLGVMAGLFVAGLASPTWLNRRLLIGPIQRLAAATRSVAAGDLETKVALERGDELGTLAESFNTMVERLGESERMLEQRVEARTRELQALLEVSHALSSALDLRALMMTIRTSRRS